MNLSAEKITDFCRSHPRCRELFHEVLLFDQVSSSNRVAFALGSNDLSRGIVILAETQTDGKGRLGRLWFSPPKVNIYLSLLLTPRVLLRDYPLFSPATAVGVIDGIHKMTKLEASIKWPNDIVIHNKKLGGILLESKTTGSQEAPIVIGLGLNVNLDKESFPIELQTKASSLKAEIGHAINRTDLVNAVLEGIAEQILRLQEGKKEAVIQSMRAHCLTLGKHIRIDTPHQIFEGWAEKIEKDGSLVIRMGDRSMRKILLGEITHLRETEPAFRST